MFMFLLQVLNVIGVDNADKWLFKLNISLVISNIKSYQFKIRGKIINNIVYWWINTKCLNIINKQCHLFLSTLSLPKYRYVLWKSSSTHKVHTIDCTHTTGRTVEVTAGRPFSRMRNKWKIFARFAMELSKLSNKQR